MSYREVGKNALRTIIKIEKNISIENYVFKISKSEEEYYNNIYQVIGDLINNYKLKDIATNLTAGKVLWEHDFFKEITSKLDEQDDFIENPFEVEEGVLECNCGSKKVFSISLQVRSCDEGMNTFAKCAKCGAKWVMRG